MLKLGVNVDHVATVRQARLAAEPSPLEAALLCQEAGAWGITAHLREDRRHMQDADLQVLAANVNFLNMEMAVTDEMLDIAVALHPNSCCLVPEKRQELTTEGGLDVVGAAEKIKKAVDKLHSNGIVVSLFIDPDDEQIQAAAAGGADYIELHTGSYSN
ncbi:MAG: pyridoxine 5'-phosphate synthase, partial [Victivallaceae bacterium]